VPAQSSAQWKLMKGICEGSIPPGNGKPSRKEACEFIRSQPSPKGLPAKKRGGKG
jgi:hypothetical protein